MKTPKPSKDKKNEKKSQKTSLLPVSNLSMVEIVEIIEPEPNKNSLNEETNLSFCTKFGIVLQIFCNKSVWKIYGLIFIFMICWFLGAVTIQYIFYIGWGPSFGFGIILGLLYSATIILFGILTLLIMTMIGEKYRMIKNDLIRKNTNLNSNENPHEVHIL